MTSRNSFFNLLKEDLHRRLWTLILSSLVFFGTFGVAFTMLIQNYVSRYSRGSYGYTKVEMIERISQNVCRNFYGCYPWFVLVAVVGAIICGMNGFAYLHSKKQMDFYHSLPIKREKIFAVRLVNGVLIYALPYLAGLLYTYLLCLIYGVMTSEIFFCGLFFFVLHLMGYLVMYLAIILAMMLTGKLVIAFFGACVINLYAPAMYALMMVLKETFLVTSYTNSVDIEDALWITRWFSPASYYYSLILSMNNEDGVFWMEFLGFLVLAAVLVVLNLWLYKKRASEKADTAMSFKVTEPVIRIMIAVPVGILAGLLFFAIQYDNGASIFWLVFGGLLGGFLAHGIIEALYNGDIKKCLSHKIQMAVTMIVAAVVPLTFLFDVFGYDSYLPKKQDIKNMAVISNELRFGGSYYDEDGWVSPINYALENMKVTNIDAMYELVEILAEDAGQNRAERFFGYSYDYVTSADGYYVSGAEEQFYTDFIIRYTLKNGSEVVRCYEYDYYKVLDILERIYNDNEFKTSVHPVFSLLESNSKLTYMEGYAPTTGISVKIEKNLDNILRAYAEDVLALTFDDLKNTAAIGELVVHFMMKDGSDNAYEDSSHFLIYPSMTRTLALLKEQGYQLQGVQEANNIGAVTIYYSGTANEFKSLLGMEVPEEDTELYYDEMSVVYEDYETYYEKFGTYPITVAAPESYQEISVTFSDPAEIAELKKYLVYRSYTSEFGPFPACYSFLNAEVYFEMSTGIYSEAAAADDGVFGWSERFRFVEGCVPQFVVDRILEELGVK